LEERRSKKVKLRQVAFVIILVFSSLTMAVAQSSTAEKLRSQLSEVQKKEGELQARDKQLEEDMKPENIEKVFALNGSTRPEELREQRRRQLENERANVRAQLDQLAQSRTRLETAIATAEAAAYTQSALPSSSYKPAAEASSGPPVVKPKPTQRRVRRKTTRRARRRG
jgi:UTP:GlnB (protein PII) uridylyltransferase